MTDNQKCEQEQITSIADAVIKLKELRESNKNLNEPDIEEKFARLSLAFKTDKITLGQRLDLQLRQRDIAEKNIDTELKALRKSLNVLNQLCTESDMRDIITKTQQHVDIVEQSTKRMSARAETYGAIQQEQRMNCAFETMLNYVEHLKLLYDKEHLELEEYRRLLAEHNLLPDEGKGSAEEDSKRALPPRSQSLSSSSKPDSKTRLLSAVCLLNNNYDSSRTAPNGSSGNLSPKSRRASLPVGPITQTGPGTTLSTIRQRTSISERHILNTERKESLRNSSALTRTESEDSTNSKPEADSPRPLQESEEEGGPPDRDSSEVSFSRPSDLLRGDGEKRLSQESNCDNESEREVCLLPNLIVPIKSKPLYFLNLLQRVNARRFWRWNNASLVLHARYTLSAILALAAMFTLVLTFVPNQMMAF